MPAILSLALFLADPAAPAAPATAGLAPVAAAPDEKAEAAAQLPATVDATAEAEVRDGYLTLKSSQMFLLFGWGTASAVAGGLAAAMVRTPWALGFELQAVAWGLIDAGLASAVLIGDQRAQRRDRRAPLPIAHWAEARAHDRELYRFNATFDLLYLGIGAAVWRFTRRPFGRGSGAGIALQGAFLLLFDGLCAWALG